MLSTWIIVLLGRAGQGRSRGGGCDGASSSSRNTSKHSVLNPYIYRALFGLGRLLLFLESLSSAQHWHEIISSKNNRCWVQKCITILTLLLLLASKGTIRCGRGELAGWLLSFCESEFKCLAFGYAFIVWGILSTVMPCQETDRPTVATRIPLMLINKSFFGPGRDKIKIKKFNFSFIYFFTILSRPREHLFNLKWRADALLNGLCYV